jgi:hypothetical protein
MPSQKRSRYLRRTRARLAQEGHPTEDRRAAMKAAARERDKLLREARVEYETKIRELEAKWEERRREIWADYDQRRDLIGQAHILVPAGEGA